jgi:HlyD family secretion protein
VIFRKVALERLSSPEQLDQLMQVTTPQAWLALSTLGGLLGAAVLWGVFGSIPTEAAGEGILLRRGGVSEVVATGGGQVEEVLPQVGEVVRRGQVVARLRQEGLQRQIQEARARRTALESEYRDLVRYAGEQRRLRDRDLGQQRANLERSIEALEKDVAIARERIAAQRKLLADGLITQQTLLATQQELNTTLDQIAAQRLELSGLELRRLEAEQQVDQQLETRRAAIRDLELSARELRAKLAEQVAVVSPYNGRVLERLVDRGDVVDTGTPLLSVEVVSEELMAVLFVPASEGKRIARGMEARIAPSTVKREEYGTLVGKVTWVAEFPSTTRGMVRLLGNEALVTRLMEEGPPIQVNVTLERAPKTPTGYRWTSSAGPDLAISSGTLAAGSIVVREQRPIRLVIPEVREKLGV